MWTRYLTVVCFLVWMCSFVGCSSGTGPDDDVIRWRAQSGISFSSWQHTDQFAKFAELVQEKSGGRLEIQIFPPGTIVDAYEQFAAVAKGAIDMGMGVGGYNLKQVPEAYIEQGLFGTFSTLNKFVDFYVYYRDGAVYKILDAAYREKGAHLLKSLGPSPLVLISKDPIHSLQEIRGLKIRGSGAAPDLITNLGAVPVTLAPAEVYIAIQTGTIDGVIMPSYTIGTINLWDVAKGVMGPPFGQVAGDMYVNLDSYNALSDDLKQVVDESAEVAMHYYVEAVTRKVDEILDLAQTERGVTVVNLPDGEYNRILQAAVPLLDTASSRSPRSKEIIDLMREYLIEKGSPINSF